MATVSDRQGNKHSFPNLDAYKGHLDGVVDGLMPGESLAEPLSDPTQVDAIDTPFERTDPREDIGTMESHPDTNKQIRAILDSSVGLIPVDETPPPTPIDEEDRGDGSSVKPHQTEEEREAELARVHELVLKTKQTIEEAQLRDPWKKR